MDFFKLGEYPFDGSKNTYTPFAGKNSNGDWIEGGISINFLNINFGQYATAQEMIESTDREDLQLFFQWLQEQGKLSV